jgi:hypothetical protein
MSYSLYEQFRELLKGDALSADEKEALSREILSIIFGEEEWP